MVYDQQLATKTLESCKVTYFFILHKICYQFCDKIYLFFVQFCVHRQGDNFLYQLIGSRKIRFTIATILIGFLLVQRYRVVDTKGYSMLCEVFGQGISLTA